jgi:ligand-binding sensor domain-containing protein
VRASIISNEVTSLVMDGQGTLWIGTPKGLSYAAASGDAGIALDEEVFCLATGPKDEVWAGTRSGLYILRGAGSSQQVFDQPVARLVFDAQGILWICTQDGRIGPLDGAEWRPKASVAELATAPPRDMLVSADGSVWLGTANGLGVLSVEGSFAWADPEEHLLQEDARALALGPDGVLWIGTANGLARQPAAGGWVRLTPTSTEGGLRSTEIWDLHMTPEGTLWIATSAGISMRTPKADWFYFDLPGARTIWPESSEVIWVGTRGGLYRLRRELLIAVP